MHGRDRSESTLAGRAERRFVIAVRVTVGYGAGFLLPWLPRLRLAAVVRPGGVCL
jgi:hypothetical protein